MTGPLIVGFLVAGALWLLLQPGRIRTVLAFVLLSHAANVTVLLASTGTGRDAPFVGGGADPADPLPQAFVLTAIVISFGTTAFLLSLAGGRRDDRLRPDDDDDAPPDDDPTDPDDPAASDDQAATDPAPDDARTAADRGKGAP